MTKRMMIEMVTNKYMLWKDGAEFVVTTKRRVEVKRGTRAECEEYINKHPYGEVMGGTRVRA